MGYALGMAAMLNFSPFQNFSGKHF